MRYFANRINLSLYFLALANAFPSASIQRATVSINVPTGEQNTSSCQVVLVGCFHGSPTSADDVRRALDDPATDGIVLELCQDRCTDLMRAEDISKASSWWTGLARKVRETRQRKGWSTAATMAVLGGVSGVLQQSTMNMQPGLEFRTALDIAEERGVDVILADQPVDITLERLGKIPKVATEIFGQNKFLAEARSLQRAVFGTKQDHVSVLSFLTRSSDSFKDVAGWLCIPVVALVAAKLLTVAGLSEDELSSSAPYMAAFDFLTIFVSYLTLALPVTRVILSERDDCLASGIHKACNGRQRVVAVLGLLHVNGVAERLSFDDGLLQTQAGGE